MDSKIERRFLRVLLLLLVVTLSLVELAQACKDRKSTYCFNKCKQTWPKKGYTGGCCVKTKTYPYPNINYYCVCCKPAKSCPVSTGTLLESWGKTHPICKCDSPDSKFQNLIDARCGRKEGGDGLFGVDVVDGVAQQDGDYYEYLFL